MARPTRIFAPVPAQSVLPYGKAAILVKPSVLFPPPFSKQSKPPADRDPEKNSLRSAYPLCRTVFLYGTDLLDPTTYSLYDCVPVGADTFLVLQDGFTISRSLEQNPWYDSSYTWDSDTYVPISATTSSTITSTWTLTRGGSTSTVSSTVTDRTSLPTLTPVIDEDVVRPKKSNTGAIAGGVVGGLAALGLAAGGTIWALMRRKEKARREASAVNEVSHVTYVHEGK